MTSEKRKNKNKKEFLEPRCFRTKLLIFVFPIVLFFVFLSIKVALPDTYLLIIQEDSIIEYPQALFYFLASIFAFLISIRFFKNKRHLLGCLYSILAFGLLFVSIEEISWAQRIFNIENPAFFCRHNYQNEISFHNLKAIHPLTIHKMFILTGAFGALAWSFNWQSLVPLSDKLDYFWEFIIPGWFLSSYFFFVFFIYMLFDYIRPFSISIGVKALRMGAFIRWRDQEPAELLLSMGFLAFVIISYINSRICLGLNKPSKIFPERNIS